MNWFKPTSKNKLVHENYLTSLLLLLLLLLILNVPLIGGRADIKNYLNIYMYVMYLFLTLVKDTQILGPNQ